VLVRKILVAMLLAVALVFVGGQANQAEAQDLDYNLINLTSEHGRDAIVVNIRTYLSIREAPSTYSRELSRIPNGTGLTIIDFNYGSDFYYVEVDYSGIRGYAHKSYVQII